MSRRSNGSYLVLASGGGSSIGITATGKSRVEIAALRHLRELYEALAPFPTTPQLPSARPHSSSSRGRVLETVRALQQSLETRAGGGGDFSPSRRANREIFNQWLTVETLSVAIDRDAVALAREIQQCELKTCDVAQLPMDTDTTTNSSSNSNRENPLESKWLVLSEVMGHVAFESYVHDLFHELQVFRSHYGLYGDTLKRFQDRVKQKCIGAHRIREVVSHSEWLVIANAALTSLDIDDDVDAAPSSPILVSHFPVLMQHCSPPPSSSVDTGNAVVVAELLKLLQWLPPPRERLVAWCFAQIGDVRRGVGVAPPPDGIRPHKLRSLAKQSHSDARCSQDELTQITHWLPQTTHGIVDPLDERMITMDTFLDFHVRVSDACGDEDAMFIGYLVRLWQFECDSPVVATVMANLEQRSGQRDAQMRKQELAVKIDHLRTVLPSKLTHLRLQIGQISALTIEKGSQYDFMLTLQPQAIGSLVGLRVLRLVDVGMNEFPAFVARLPLLEEMDLSENRLAREPLPVGAIGGMKALKTLTLRGCTLRDRSFVVPLAGSSETSATWQSLTALETLDMAHNELTSIPSVVVQLRRLTSLNLASNKLKQNGIALQVATQWSDQGFPRLRVLDLRGNELTTLPEAVFTTGKATLERLYVQDNQLLELPKSFAALEAIREVALSRNRLRNVGHINMTALLLRCSGWTALLLEENQLKMFPFESPQGSVQRLSIQGLQTIHLAKNTLRVLPELANLVFAGCQELDLHSNAITEISDHFFQAFPVLRVCQLQKNAITVLPASLTLCQHLEVLNVAENKLASVAPELVRLRKLTVLSLRQNRITTIPTEWHTFASNHRPPEPPLRLGLGQRLLHTLELQGNPLRNKVLQSLVDGAHSEQHTGFKSSATHLCETYLRKLIDTLKPSVPVERLARALHVDNEEEEEEGNSEGDDDGTEAKTRRKRRWKGGARFVVQYVETQLRACCDDHALLLVAKPAFVKLQQRLMVASTSKERKLISERFACQQDGAVVDGYAFLCGVEQVGLFNGFQPLSQQGDGDRGATARCESVRKPVDVVTSILQYLHVAHDHKTRVVLAEEQETKPPSSACTARPRTAPQQRPAQQIAKAQVPRSTGTPARPSRNQQQDAKNKRDTRESSVAKQRSSEMDRQRARIQVLEQQLLDQQLLRVTEQQPPQPPRRGGLGLGVPVFPVEKHEPDQQTSRVMVHIKQLSHAASSSTGSGPPTEQVAIAMAAHQSVVELKQAIAQRLQVPIARQVLIARRATDHVNVRLNDDSPLASYCLPLADPSRRWTVSLLVSDQWQIDWSSFRQRATSIGSKQPAAKEDVDS